jgi:hypothetical protein
MAPGQGMDNFTSNIPTLGDTLELKPALAATNWNGAASTLANYMTMTDSAQGATLSITATRAAWVRRSQHQWRDRRYPDQPAGDSIS